MINILNIVAKRFTETMKPILAWRNHGLRKEKLDVAITVFQVFKLLTLILTVIQQKRFYF